MLDSGFNRGAGDWGLPGVTRCVEALADWHVLGPALAGQVSGLRAPVGSGSSYSSS